MKTKGQRKTLAYRFSFTADAPDTGGGPKLFSVNHLTREIRIWAGAPLLWLPVICDYAARKCRETFPGPGRPEFRRLSLPPMPRSAPPGWAWLSGCYLMKLVCPQ